MYAISMDDGGVYSVFYVTVFCTVLSLCCIESDTNERSFLLCKSLK